MERPVALTPLQVEVAQIFFGLRASKGFLVAGGAALLASELIVRPTEDLDLFASSPIASVVEAKLALTGALEDRAYQVVVVQDSPTFCRIVVRGAEQEILVDLGVDSPPLGSPTMTVLGPTLAPLELASRKLLALFGRAEARDFADVALLVRRFGKEELLKGAASLDGGFDSSVLAQMMRTLDRFTDDEIPLDGAGVRQAREFFSDWADSLQHRA
ncbi:nucleotidyl transferase AbiEii/AbiGii toxin family protein [Nocardioides sp. Bht2]|uniref:nucleotidyl transferase AbiEii/AbiGii toxin family protein n=1 Tax=Nocardioides sp. Bht2 TaxID=3392297 RepID=UPI0039B4B826